MEKVKIVLDADVLIHFSKAGYLHLLPQILPEYDHVVLSTVYDEVKTIQLQLDNQILFLKNIKKEQFAPTGEMRREYARLLTLYDPGESACMAYCRYTNNVIGSSNLSDIKDYCKEQQIVFLTTLDFLYHAFTRGVMTQDQCNQFIADVRANGSKLPVIRIENYAPNMVL